jgi:hypothetical protein
VTKAFNEALQVAKSMPGWTIIAAETLERDGIEGAAEDDWNGRGRIADGTHCGGALWTWPSILAAT